MKSISDATIRHLIEAHINGDDARFNSWAEHIAQSYEDHGDDNHAKLIRDLLNSVDNRTLAVLDGQVGATPNNNEKIAENKPAEVVDFEKYQGKTYITPPSWEEVQCLKMLTSQYGHDEMVDVACWDGSCWETIFKTMKEHALSIGCDPWDTFAVFVTKLMGTTFEETDKGWVVTRGRDK